MDGARGARAEDPASPPGWTGSCALVDRRQALAVVASGLYSPKFPPLNKKQPEEGVFAHNFSKTPDAEVGKENEEREHHHGDKLKGRAAPDACHRFQN